MAINAGKKWEDYFRQNWKECFPRTFVYRLPDQVSGYKQTSANPCDFFCFVCNRLFMIECKTHKGNSIPFAAIPQYSRLLEYKNMKNIFPGVLIWFVDKDIVVWVGIEELEKMKNNKEKSISLKMLENKLYNIVEIPAEKKRVFMHCDYTYLLDICKLEKENKNE